MIPVFPDTNELNEDSKAEMAEGAIPSASILALIGANEAIVKDINTDQFKMI
jgi:hypothetical protein